MRGTVACGHPLTAAAAEEMLTRGGNAFDAVVAAGFASVVTEPTLTSLGGGGFLLAHLEKQREDILFDFFVNTPGLNSDRRITPHMTPVEIKFPQSTQIFHTGFSSAAVPGMLKGLIYIHGKLCRLALETILEPAIRHLDNGVEVTDLQEYFLSLLEPIFSSTEYGRDIYLIDGHFVRRSERLFNPMLREYFRKLAGNGDDFYRGKTAEKFIEHMRNENGMITLSDLNAYEVIERSPLRIRYRNSEILTNPPPSSGGIKLALGLHLLERIDLSSLSFRSAPWMILLTEVMKRMNDFNPLLKDHASGNIMSDADLSGLISSFMKEVSTKIFISKHGTTHISVIDEVGNAASMTTSNGSGSGCFIPGTGIMLNNMMGEDDLHPDGFFSSPPHKRVSSMMAPTILLKEGRVDTVLGSGGSKRIRNAILQVLVNMIDFEYPLEWAVEAPRIHFEDNILHAEPTMTLETEGELRKHYELNLWDRKDMYFGGVHCVNSRLEGWGDSRREGNVIQSQ